MLSHVAVLHAVRLALNLASFVMKASSLAHCWITFTIPDKLNRCGEVVTINELHWS